MRSYGRYSTPATEDSGSYRDILWRCTSRRKWLYGEVGGGEDGGEEVLLSFLIGETYLKKGDILSRDYTNDRVWKRCQRIQHPFLYKVERERNEGGVS